MPFAAIGSALGISAGAAAIGTASLVGGIASSVIGGNAADDAANTQAAAADRSSQVQLDMFNRTKADEQPYVDAGGNALQALMRGIGIGDGTGNSGQGPLNTPFSLDQFHNSPGYQFQVQEGNKSILNNRASLGGVNSGNTLKALMDRGQQTANGDYWNAYNAYVNGQNQKFGQLQTVAGSGQNAAANIGALGAQTGASVGNNIVGAGNASAAGTVGSAKAINNGINNTSQNFLLYNMLHGDFSGGGGSGGGQNIDQIINSLYPG